MTLTVRLDDSTAAALAEHCAAHGVTKSRVVQQSLAAFLMRTGATQERVKPSTNCAAFDAAGFLGTGDFGSAPADKPAVRLRVTGKR